MDSGKKNAKNQNSIKKDLLYVYETLYKSGVLESGSLFSKELVEKLKYTPEQITQVLGLANGEQGDNAPFAPNATKMGARFKGKTGPKKEAASKRDAATFNIASIDGVRNFYYGELRRLYDNSLDEGSKAEILNSISLGELKRLHSIISSVSMPGNVRKKDVVDMLRYYFSDEKRAMNLAKSM
jgi:hypothetical protein